MSSPVGPVMEKPKGPLGSSNERTSVVPDNFSKTKKHYMQRIDRAKEDLKTVKPGSDEFTKLQAELGAVRMEVLAQNSPIWFETRRKNTAKYVDNVLTAVTMREKGMEIHEIERSDLLTPIRDPWYMRPGGIAVGAMLAIPAVFGGYFGAKALMGFVNGDAENQLGGPAAVGSSIDNPIKTEGPSDVAKNIALPVATALPADIAKLSPYTSATAYPIGDSQGDLFWGNIYPALAASDQGDIVSPFDLQQSKLRDDTLAYGNKEIKGIDLYVQDPTKPDGIFVRYHTFSVNENGQVRDHYQGAQAISAQAALKIIDAAAIKPKS